MRTRTDAPTTGRWRCLAVTVAIAAAALMGACDNNATAETNATAEVDAASPGSTNPREALLAATPTKNSERYAITFSTSDDTGGSASGVVDPAAHRVLWVSTLPESDDGPGLVRSVIAANDDHWARVKYTGPVKETPGATIVGTGIPDKWFHLDKTRVHPGDIAPDATNMSDPLTVVATLDHAVEVTEPSPGKYAGTLDLSKADGLELVPSDEGEKFTAVPFEAETDSAGRLASFALKLPATDTEKAKEIKMRFSDYGSAPAVTVPPAGKTPEAPEDLYLFFFA